MFAQALGADTKWKRLEHGAISGHSAILSIFQGFIKRPNHDFSSNFHGRPHPNKTRWKSTITYKVDRLLNGLYGMWSSMKITLIELIELE